MIHGDMGTETSDITIHGEVLGDGTTGDTEDTTTLVGVDLVTATDGATTTTIEDFTTLTTGIDIIITTVETLMPITIAEEVVMTTLFMQTTEKHMHVLVDLT